MTATMCLVHFPDAGAVALAYLGDSGDWNVVESSDPVRVPFGSHAARHARPYLAIGDEAQAITDEGDVDAVVIGHFVPGATGWHASVESKRGKYPVDPFRLQPRAKPRRKST